MGTKVDERAGGGGAGGECPMVALERFVAENEELLELERRLGRFNLFDALGIARAEIRHSNFLGWLLDPGESHGQGDVFLKAILMDVLRKAPRENRPLSPVEIDGAELTDVDVRREWKHIDLLIHCRNPGFVIAIENKMHGFERAEKLGRYEKAVAEAFPGVPTMFVFLNPDGDEAPDEDWFAYSYRDVHRVLRRVREACAGSLGTDVGVILDHYLRLLETRLMDDPKIAELCRLIYKNHRQAIDLIIEHGGTGGGGLLGELADRLSSMPGWRIVARGGGRVLFAHERWADKLPPIGDPRDNAPQSWISFRLSSGEGKLTLRLRTRSVADVEARNRFLAQLFEAGGAIGIKPKFKSWQTQNRMELWSETIATWEEHDEPDADQVLALVLKKAQALSDQLTPVLGRIKHL